MPLENKYGMHTLCSNIKGIILLESNPRDNKHVHANNSILVKVANFLINLLLTIAEIKTSVTFESESRLRRRLVVGRELIMVEFECY